MTLARTREGGRRGAPRRRRGASRSASARLPPLALFLGGLNGLLSVAAGAYGRHGALEQAGREMFGIATNYQIAHGLGLLAVAWLESSPLAIFGR